jgi:hypothetical protein
MKRKKGLIIALYVAVLPSLTLGQEAIPLPLVDVRPGLTCTEPRKWDGNDVSRQTVNCLDIGLGFALSRKTSLRVDTGLGLSRVGAGLRYRYSNLADVEFARLTNGSYLFVYRRKL